MVTGTVQRLHSNGLGVMRLYRISGEDVISISARSLEAYEHSDPAGHGQYISESKSESVTFAGDSYGSIACSLSSVAASD